jgi:hypothetical protein
MTDLQQTLLENAESYWVKPTPSLEYILSGCEFEKGPWDGWGRFIPSDLREHWNDLSEEVRIVAYCVAVEGVNRVQDLLDDD